MEVGLNIKCSNHEKQNPNFYCFEEKEFLCDACFKEHKKHDIETLSEIQKSEKFYKNLVKNKFIADSLEEIKNILNEIKNDMECKLNEIDSIIISLKNLNPSLTNNNIFNLNYQEYVNIGEISKIFDSLGEIYKKFNKLNKYKIKKEYTNLREINKEVNIIEHSKEYIYNPLNIMLGKNSGVYSLFDGSKNHFAIFDLQKKLYLKDILISVKQKYGCVLKNFKVSIKNEYGNWEEQNSFCCQNNNSKKEIQSFPIEKETQFVKINFIDAWSKNGGNFILIKKLSFRVADIN